MYKYAAYFSDTSIEDIKTILEPYGLISYQYMECLWYFETEREVKKLPMKRCEVFMSIGEMEDKELVHVSTLK